MVCYSSVIQSVQRVSVYLVEKSGIVSKLRASINNMYSNVTHCHLDIYMVAMGNKINYSRK